MGRKGLLDNCLCFYLKVIYSKFSEIFHKKKFQKKILFYLLPAINGREASLYTILLADLLLTNKYVITAMTDALK